MYPGRREINWYYFYFFHKLCLGLYGQAVTNVMLRCFKLFEKMAAAVSKSDTLNWVNTSSPLSAFVIESVYLETNKSLDHDLATTLKRKTIEIEGYWWYGFIWIYGIRCTISQTFGKCIFCRKLNFQRILSYFVNVI